MNNSLESQQPNYRWKGGGGNQDSPLAAGGSPGKWSATIVTLLLVSLLGYFLYRWWQPTGQIVWAAVRVGTVAGDHDSGLSVGMTNALGFQEAEGGAKRSRNQFLDLKDLEQFQQDWGGGLSKSLEKAELTERDAFVLYMVTRTFTRNGKAYLELSDSNTSDDTNVDDIENQSVALADVLQALRQCKAGTKLLILDAVPIGFDPRRGILFNDFPHCAAREIKAAGDEGIWVLLSHSDFQMTGEYASFGPTLLDALTAQAVSGGALPAGDKAKFLTLSELCRFVVSNSARLFEDHPEEAPIPLLLRGRHGVVDIDDDQQFPERQRVARLNLTEKEDAKKKKGPGVTDKAKNAGKRELDRSIRQVKPRTPSELRLFDPNPRLFAQEDDVPQSKTPSTTGDKSDKSDETQPDQPAKGPTKQKGPAASEAAGITTGNGKQPADTNPDATVTDQMDAASVAMWTAWADLQDPTRDFWSPVDGCPHLWRQLNRKLLQQAKSWRSASPANDQTPALREITSDLTKLSRFLQQVSRSERANTLPTFNSRFRIWLTPIAEKCRDAEWLTHDATTDTSYAVRDQAVRWHNYALYCLPDYVSWQAASPRGDLGQTASPFKQRATDVRLFIGQLKSLRDELAGLDGQQLDSDSSLQASVAKTSSSLGKLQEHVFEDVEFALQWNDLAGEVRTAILLDSPVVPPAKRRQLLARWRTMQASASPSSRLSNEPFVASEMLPARWDRVADLVLIQQHVIELFAPAAAATLVEKIESLSPADAKDRLDAYGQIGSDLEAFYGALAAKTLVKSSPDEPKSEHRHKLGLVRLVDWRDVHRIDHAPLPVWKEFDIRVKRRKAELIFATQQQRHPLLLEQTLSIEIPFTAVAISGPVTVSVAYANSTIAVTRQDGNKLSPCASGDPFTVTLDTTEKQEHVLRLNVEPLRARVRDDEESQKLTVLFQASGLAGGVSQTILCDLPRPDQIDLIVRRKGAKAVRPEGDIFRLRSFPNRNTQYQFYLANRGDSEKTVIVELFRLPKLANQTWAPGRLRDSNGNRLASGLREAAFIEGDPSKGIKPSFRQTHLLRSVEATVRPEDKELPLSFAAAPPKEPADGSETGSAPTERALGDVAYGMLLCITDKANPQKSWPKWLELSVLHPRYYVSVDGLPEFQNNAIGLQVRLIEGDGFVWTKDEPVKVSWGNSPPVDLTSDFPVRPLTKGDLAPDGQIEWIYLTVDGYPRAFIFETLRENSNAPDRSIAWLGRRAAIQIDRITAQFSPPESPDAKSIPNIVREISKKQDVISFQNCDQLLVQFSADVPDNLYAGDYKGSPSILLMEGGNIVAGPYFADRRIITSLVALDELVTVNAQVSDYAEVLTAGTENAAISLTATLPTQLNQAPSKVTVNLDSKLPTVETDSPRYLIDLARPARLEVTLSDSGAGLDRFHCGIVAGMVKDPQDVDEGTLKRQFHLGAPTPWRKTIEIKTDGLGLEPKKEYSIVLICYDRAGNRQFAVRPLMVREPPPPRPDGDIVGIVQGATGIGWYVKITGQGISPISLGYGTKTDNGNAGFENGRYWVKHLKPGEYTVSAEGRPGGRLKTSTRSKVKVTAGMETKHDITEFEDPKE